MAPRKKARLSSRAASTPTAIASHPEPSTPAAEEPSQDDLMSDPWTDEQETSLFKSMIRWKPIDQLTLIGMHKHFRMIAISENLRNHGYTSLQDNHTRIPGIWEKLNSLYNLEALDERENDTANQDNGDVDPITDPFSEFVLPKEEFGDITFARRLALEGSQSPRTSSSHMPSGRSSRNRRHSTIDDTDDPQSSPASNSGPVSVRGTRSRPAGRSQLQSVSVPVSRARTGKAPTDEIERDDEDELGLDREDERPRVKATNTSKGVQNASKATESTSTRRKSGRRR